MVVQIHHPPSNMHNLRPLVNTDLTIQKGSIVMKYVCPCGYEYDPAVGDPDNGIEPGTAFEDLPEDFVCPICGLDKDAFEKEE